MKYSHQTVFLEEAIFALQIIPNGFYLDATFGRGGHSSAILKQLGSEGRLLCLDRDPEAIKVAQALFSQDPRVFIAQDTFSNLEQFKKNSIGEKGLDGIIFDLGVSSPQLDDPLRGFSFSKDGPLDFRMDPSKGEPASSWLSKASIQEMAQIFFEYGEEPLSYKIAKKIVYTREHASLETTLQLSNLIESVVGKFERKKHPATRVFQAIRIHINQELSELKSGLEFSLKVLKIGGILAVISFHSLEDRIVKHAFKASQNFAADLLKKMPLRKHEMPLPSFKIFPKQLASLEMVQKNPRSRSARLRIIKKLK